MRARDTDARQLRQFSSERGRVVRMFVSCVVFVVVWVAVIASGGFVAAKTGQWFIGFFVGYSAPMIGALAGRFVYVRMAIK